jgi:hypothetical protein
MFDGSWKTSGSGLVESEGAGMEGGSSRDGGDWRLARGPLSEMHLASKQRVMELDRRILPRGI